MHILKFLLGCILLSLVATFFYSLGSLRTELKTIANQKRSLEKELVALEKKQREPLGLEISPPPKPATHPPVGYINEYYPNDKFVSINTLSGHSLTPNTKLLITRDSKKIGEIIISTIEGNSGIADVLDYTFSESPICINPKDTLIAIPSK